LKSEISNPKSEIQNRKSVIVGHDTPISRARICAGRLRSSRANGLEPLLCDRDTPTPVIAYAIVYAKRSWNQHDASHNPAEYQGLKFSTSNGAPATPEVTKQIETNIAKLQSEYFRSKGAVIGTYNCKTFNRSRIISSNCTSSSIFPFSKSETQSRRGFELWHCARSISINCFESVGAKITLFS